MRILVVEDEPELAEVIIASLEEEHYAVDWAENGKTADECVGVNDYDLVVLDWSIPPPSGLELLQRWRESSLEMPVLMLTGRTTVGDRVDGLDHGADDYLTKPFSFDELLARIRSLLRRRSKSLAVLQAGDLEMNRSSRVVTVAGSSIQLSPKEFGILEYLLNRVGQTVSRTELAEHVWDATFDAMSNTIDVLIYRLRKKIDGDRKERLLHTIKGVGYILWQERN